MTMDFTFIMFGIAALIMITAWVVSLFAGRG